MKLSRSYGSLLLLLVFALVNRAGAQGFGTIVGTVTDASGSVIPNAKLTVTDEGTQAIRTVQANDQGYYVVPALHPSTYDLNVNVPGFAVYSQKAITLLADQSLTVDVRMSLGQVTETVSVETNNVQVDTSTSTLS